MIFWKKVLKLIKRAGEKEQDKIILPAITVCDIEQNMKHGDWHIRAKMMRDCKGKDVPLSLLEKGFRDEDEGVRIDAICACAGRGDISLSVVQEWLEDSDPAVLVTALEMIKKEGFPLSLPLVQPLLCHDLEWVRMAAISACKVIKDLPISMIEEWMEDEDKVVRRAAMEVCENRDIPPSLLEKGLYDEWGGVRLKAAEICKGKNIPLSKIQEWAQNADWIINIALRNTCDGRTDISTDVIDRWIKKYGLKNECLRNME